MLMVHVTSGIPVLIKVEHGHIDELAVTIKDAKKIEMFDLISANLTAEEIKTLLKNEHVEDIYYDVDVRAVDEIQMLSLPDLFSPTAAGTGGGDLWNLQAVNVSGVWSKGYKGEGVRIAVIDTGVNAEHPDIQGRVVDFADFINGLSEPYDDNGHGTHVAGTIAGKTTGVAPESEIIAVKVLDSHGSGKLSTVLMGIEWAYENGADVISMSLGALPGIGGSFGKIVNPEEFSEVSLPVYPSLKELYADLDNYIPTFIRARINPDVINYVWAAPPYGGKRVLERDVQSNFTLKFDVVGYVNSGYFAVKVRADDGYVELLNLSSVNYNTWRSFKLTSPVGGTLIFESYGNCYLWIDNIEIPEEGFFDDVESGNEGWLSNGWFIVMHTWSKDIPDGFEVKFIKPDGSIATPECTSTGSYLECRYDQGYPLESGNWTIQFYNGFTRKIEVDVDAYVVYPSNGYDLLSEAVNEISDKGTTVVVAAGNAGELGDRTIASPASAKKAITVGAVDRYNRVAYFSSRGPVGFGTNSYIKPDVVAPGVSVTSLWKDGGYVSFSGTSMATPHVSGIVALMLEANPQLKPADVKEVLEKTALDIGDAGKDTESGAGVVDAYKAVMASLNESVEVNQPPVVDFEVIPVNPVAGQQVFFKSKSYDPDGKIIWIKWDFGDGSSWVGPFVTHTYEEAGDYTVTVTARDNDGLLNTTSRIVHVYSQEAEMMIIEGYVRNSVGSPVVSEITATTDSASYAVRTDSNGYFKLEIDGRAEIAVKADGYETYYFTADSGGFYNVTLRDITPPTIIVADLPEYVNTTAVDVHVEVFDNETGVKDIECSVDGGEWRPIGTLNLDEGSHTIIIRAVDYDGNDARKDLGITVDITPPEIEVVDVLWQDSTLVITVKPSEELRELMAVVDGQYKVEKISDLWKVEIVAPGLEKVKLVAKDLAGNVCEKVVDVPAKKGIQLIKPRDITNTPEFTFELSAPMQYVIYVDGVEVYRGSGNGVVSVKIPIEDGYHEWWVAAGDDFESERVSFILDTVKPEALYIKKESNTLILKPSEKLRRATAEDVNGVVEMHENGEVWTCSVNGYHFVITMEDLAGNIGRVEYTSETVSDVNVDFVYIPENIKAGKPVFFKGIIDKTKIKVRYIRWDFGDGKTWVGIAVAHIYNEPGTYTVKMTVADYSNNKMEVEKIINVV
jgi:subtilisin family serine protease